MSLKRNYNITEHTIAKSIHAFSMILRFTNLGRGTNAFWVADFQCNSTESSSTILFDF